MTQDDYEAFERWLDEGHSGPSPEFTDALMSRVASIEASRPAARPWVVNDAGALPWWAEIMRQPAAALAVIAAALLAWRMNAVLAAASTAIARLGAWGEAVSRLSAGGQAALLPMRSGDALIVAGVLMGLTPLAIVASTTLGRWVARVALLRLR